MAKMSFNEVTTDAAGVPTATVSTAIVPVEELPVSTEVATFDEFGGESARGDFVMPKLNLANKVGDLGNQFAPGTFVFSKEVALNEAPDKEFPISVLAVSRWWQESFEFGDEAQPRRVRSEKEVAELAGTTLWEQKHSKQLWARVAEIATVIQKPKRTLLDEQEALFPYEFNGDFYAVAKWTVAKTAYKAVIPMLNMAHTTWSKGQLYAAQWNLSAQLRKTDKFSWWSPVIKAAGKATDPKAEFLLQRRVEVFGQ